MAGLNLMAGANVGVAPPVQPAGTVGQAAFGPGYTAAGAPSSSTALAPNDPFGVALWVGIGALAVLLFVRYSLPA